MNKRPKEVLLKVLPQWDKNSKLLTVEDFKTEKSITHVNLERTSSPMMHCPMRKKRPTRDSDFSAIVVPSMHGSGYLDYTVETHASRSLRVMDEFRQQEMLCDLVLHVNYKEKTVDFKVKHVKSV